MFTGTIWSSARLALSRDIYGSLAAQWDAVWCLENQTGGNNTGIQKYRAEQLWWYSGESHCLPEMRRRGKPGWRDLPRWHLLKVESGHQESWNKGKWAHLSMHLFPRANPHWCKVINGKLSEAPTMSCFRLLPTCISLSRASITKYYRPSVLKSRN